MIKPLRDLATKALRSIVSKLVPKAIEYLGADLRDTAECYHLRPSGMGSFVSFRAFPGQSVTICTECGIIEAEEIGIEALVKRLELN